jgi:hypothetical protein
MMCLDMMSSASLGAAADAELVRRVADGGEPQKLTLSVDLLFELIRANWL